jgi:hypothetical protein
VSSQGVVGKEVQKDANKPPCQPKYMQNGAKNRRFAALIDLKIAKNTLFCSNVLTKIYS